MNCPKCGCEQDDGGAQCIHCGIYFFKYKRAEQRRAQLAKADEPSLLWQVKEASDPVYKTGRALMLFALLWLSWGLIFSPIGYWQGNGASHSFLHLINIPFHETGHLIFRPLGRLMHSLGGTLGQLLMPLICLVVLLWKTRDAFGAAACLWWLGESFLDTVSYINDALHLSMPLLGGNVGSRSPYGFHDWEFILTETGLLQQASGLAKATHILGSLLMVLAMTWMVLLLLRTYKK